MGRPGPRMGTGLGDLGQILIPSLALLRQLIFVSVISLVKIQETLWCDCHTTQGRGKYISLLLVLQPTPPNLCRIQCKSVGLPIPVQFWFGLTVNALFELTLL